MYTSGGEDGEITHLAGSVDIARDLGSKGPDTKRYLQYLMRVRCLNTFQELRPESLFKRGFKCFWNFLVIASKQQDNDEQM